MNVNAHPTGSRRRTGIVACLLLLGLAAGCAQQSEPLQVTYYYLPG